MPRQSSSDSFSARLLNCTLALSILFIAFIVPSFPGHGYDSWCWREWTIHIQKEGLLNAYGSGTDYPPAMQYVLWIFGMLMDGQESVVENYHYLRLLTYAVDVLGVYLVWRWTGRRGAFAAIALFSLINITSSYNTIIWGQVDGILATLVCAALYAAWKGRLAGSGVLMMLAVLFKLQAIVFVPLWGLLMLGTAARLGTWRRIPLVLVAMLLTGTCILLPFVLTEVSRGQLAEAIFGSVGRYPKITPSANNWWQFVNYNNAQGPDNLPWIGDLTYEAVGLLVFCMASAIALWPLLAHTVGQFRQPNTGRPFPKERLWLTAALVAVNFFFWLTQMHERYSHPAFIFLLAFALCTRDWVPYIVFCVAYFLNIENILQVLHLENYDTFIFDPRFGAVLYALLLVYLSARLYGWRGSMKPSVMPAEEQAPSLQQA